MTGEELRQAREATCYRPQPTLRRTPLSPSTSSRFNSKRRNAFVSTTTPKLALDRQCERRKLGAPSSFCVGAQNCEPPILREQRHAALLECQRQERENRRMNVIATEKGDPMERDLLRYEAKHYDYSSKAILCTSDIKNAAFRPSTLAGMQACTNFPYRRMHSPLESDYWNIL